jgi:hypothetical protein
MRATRCSPTRSTSAAISPARRCPRGPERGCAGFPAGTRQRLRLGVVTLQRTSGRAERRRADGSFAERGDLALPGARSPTSSRRSS